MDFFDFFQGKTIMSTVRFSSLVQDLYERHFKFLDADIKSLAASINENFCSDKKIMICHCCTSNGHGYFTVSSEDKKVVVSSDYPLEPVGGCWSLIVYERLFFSQIFLTKYLTAIKMKLSLGAIFNPFEMPVKILYISYILTDLISWEGSHNEYYYSNEREKFKIASGYQRAFLDNYSDEVNMYNSRLAYNSNFFDYYNGNL